MAANSEPAATPRRMRWPHKTGDARCEGCDAPLLFHDQVIAAGRHLWHEWHYPGNPRSNLVTGPLGELVPRDELDPGDQPGDFY